MMLYAGIAAATVGGMGLVCCGIVWRVRKIVDEWHLFDRVCDLVEEEC